MIAGNGKHTGTGNMH